MNQITFFEIPTVISPIWYIGSKAKLVPYLKPYLSELLKTKELVSPFIGGGSVELYLSAQDIRVYASDNFYFLVNFWKQLKSDPNKLIDTVWSWWEEANNHTDLFTMIHELKDPIDQAAVFWIVNKQSYRGSTLAMANPSKVSTVQVSFEAFEKYKNFSSNNLSIDLLDYKDALEQHQNKCAYLDPPYVNRAKLYGDGSAPEFDHKALRNILSGRTSPWILSYNDDEYIKSIYKDFYINRVSWLCHVTRKGAQDMSELLISNFEPEKQNFI